MTAAPTEPVPPAVSGSAVAGPARTGPLLLALGAGLAVSLALGVYGRVHAPTGVAISLAGFSSGLAAKTWLTTTALAFGIVQLLTGLALFGRIPIAGVWLPPVHRWSGRIAVLITVPVAMHCLYALGFQDYEPRVLMHSLLGCFFFGAFVAKMLILTRDDPPGWALPVLGGIVVSVLTMLWLTASLWFLVYRGFTF